MSLNQETYTLEEWQMIDKGIKIPKKKPILRPEPEMPIIKNQLKFDDLEVDSIKRIKGVAEVERVRNAQGIIFLVYRIELEMQDGTVKAGVALEGDAIKIRRLPWVRENSDSRILNVIH